MLSYVPQHLIYYREGYNTKGNIDTQDVGYDYKPAGHQKIEYVVYSEPIQVQSYGGYGHGSSYDNKGSYGHGYSNKGYDNKGYDNKGYDNKGYDNKGYKSSY